MAICLTPSNPVAITVAVKPLGNNKSALALVPINVLFTNDESGVRACKVEWMQANEETNSAISNNTFFMFLVGFGNKDKLPFNSKFVLEKTNAQLNNFV